MVIKRDPEATAHALYIQQCREDAEESLHGIIEDFRELEIRVQWPHLAWACNYK